MQLFQKDAIIESTDGAVKSASDQVPFELQIDPTITWQNLQISVLKAMSSLIELEKWYIYPFISEKTYVIEDWADPKMEL